MNSLLESAPASQIPVRLRGVDGLAEAELDVLEHARRWGDGVAGKALAGVDVLDALLRLPEGVPIPISRISQADLTEFEALHGALVYPADGVVLRVCRPAATASLLSIPTDSWRQGMRLAHRFAPYCARRILLEKEPRESDLLVLEASYWGIGVSVAGDGGERLLVAPGRFSPTRYTGAAWWFDECLYSQVSSRLVDGAANQLFAA